MTSYRDEVTTSYIFNSSAFPEDLLDEKLIRDADKRGEITVDTASYMQTGGGRFANASMFELVSKFFNNSTAISSGIYTKQALAAAFSLDSYGLDIRQFDYVDGVDDYVERTYVFNSGRFMIADTAEFIVHPDGSREILNFAVVPREDDNFDFVGGGLSALLGNALWEPEIDPSGIGRTVDIRFTNVGNVPLRTYSASDYVNDQAIVSSWSPPNPNDIARLLDVPQQLWDDGVTKLLVDYKGTSDDSDDRLVIYGTNDSDDFSTGIDDKISSIMEPYSANGLAIVAGKGNDYVVGSDYSDLLLGGSGDDTLVGGKTTETLSQTIDDTVPHRTWDDGKQDVLNGGTGFDTYLISHLNGSMTGWASDIESVFSKIDIIDEHDGDGRGRLAVQQVTDFGMGLNVLQLKIEGSYIKYRLYPENESYGANEPMLTYYGNDEAYYLTSYTRSEGGQAIPYVFIMQAYPYTEEPIAAIRDFRQGDFGIYLEGFVGRKEGTDGDDIYQGNGGAGNRALGNSRAFLQQSESASLYNEIVSIGNPDSNQRIHMGAGNDIAYGRGGDDEIRGDAGEDQLYGNEGNDTLSGGDGNDLLEGNEGADRLSGNVGDDLLSGGKGADTYVYTRGDGSDIISGEGDFVNEADVLHLTDILESDVSVSRTGNDLIIAINGTAETITVTGQFGSQAGWKGVESILFANGVVWDKAALSAILGNDSDGPIIGTNGDDTLYGSSGVDTIHGQSGDDTIYGLSGDDSLSGDGGNDIVFGGQGNDAYFYVQGSGSDTIVEISSEGDADSLTVSGLNFDDVEFTRQGEDLVITVPESATGAGDGGSILVTNTLLDDDAGIESFVFQDWTYTKTDIRSVLLSQLTTTGDDVIEGFHNTGDYLEGGAGNDAFVFKPDFGWDTIGDFVAGAGTDDVLEFRGGVLADFEAVLAAASQVGNDTIINIDGTNGITLANVNLADLHRDDVRFVA
ncbi:calcium-binding protein [Agrobacterium sp. NPDC090283]|uniref:calcium-binding protein n=1 Tax=Agrobacterium sp. NPDC090283 TaxID=3363920 RepID=UPI00383B5FCA